MKRLLLCALALSLIAASYWHNVARQDRDVLASITDPPLSFAAGHGIIESGSRSPFFVIECGTGLQLNPIPAEVIHHQNPQMDTWANATCGKRIVVFEEVR